ncbi:MAG: hypothetical protein RL097_655, partial [Candidatus Parcubacteria bacterium]
MEKEKITNPENSELDNGNGLRGHLTNVTPLSKYLAMLLFVT